MQTPCQILFANYLSWLGMCHVLNNNVTALLKQ